MRIFLTDMSYVSLAKRNKNRFWVEEESREWDNLRHYEVVGISWRRFKKKKKQSDEELYLWW